MKANGKSNVVHQYVLTVCWMVRINSESHKSQRYGRHWVFIVSCWFVVCRTSFYYDLLWIITQLCWNSRVLVFFFFISRLRLSELLFPISITVCAIRSLKYGILMHCIEFVWSKYPNDISFSHWNVWYDENRIAIAERQMKLRFIPNCLYSV